MVTVFGCKPISFFMADDVFPLAFSSSNFPNNIKAITTAAASKYTCACKPLLCQNSGNKVLKTLKIYATPVLSATKVSMLEERCLACFQAFTKNCFPKNKTTGVAKAHII